MILNSEQIFRDFSPRANAIIRFTEQIGWAQIHLFLAFTAVLSAAPSAIEYAKNVERGETETNGLYSSELKRQQEINQQFD